MNCKICENILEDGDTAILGVCARDIEALVVGAVKEKRRKAEVANPETGPSVPEEPAPGA